MAPTDRTNAHAQSRHHATEGHRRIRPQRIGATEPPARMRGYLTWQGIATAAVLFLAVATPALAQQVGNPFAGRAAGGRGPYGSDAGAATHIMQLPQLAQAAVGAAAGQPRGSGVVAVQEGERTEQVHTPESGGNFWEIVFASCAGGAFLGGVTALSTTEVVAVGTAAVAPAGLALPVLAGAAASAAGIGCGLGASTAAISLGAAALWQRAFR